MCCFVDVVWCLFMVCVWGYDRSGLLGWLVYGCFMVLCVACGLFDC